MASNGRNDWNNIVAAYSCWPLAFWFGGWATSTSWKNTAEQVVAPQSDSSPSTPKIPTPHQLWLDCASQELSMDFPFEMWPAFQEAGRNLLCIQLEDVTAQTNTAGFLTRITKTKTYHAVLNLADYYHENLPHELGDAGEKVFAEVYGENQKSAGRQRTLRLIVTLLPDSTSCNSYQEAPASWEIDSRDRLQRTIENLADLRCGLGVTLSSLATPHTPTRLRRPAAAAIANIIPILA